MSTKYPLNLHEVHKATMHTVPLYVVGGMVCAVCAPSGHFVQRRPQINPQAACTTTHSLSSLQIAGDAARKGEAQSTPKSSVAPRECAGRAG